MSSVSMGLLDVVYIVRRRWLVLISASLLAAAAAYLLLPTPPTTFRGTATLATNGHATPTMIDRATAAGNATGARVAVQDDEGRILINTSAQSEDEAKATLEAAMTPLLSAKLFDEDRKKDAENLKFRTEEELSILRGALDLLLSTPPTSASGEYTPASYTESVLPLSARISELSADLYEVNKQIDMPLALSGIVTYDYTPERSGSRIILAVLFALALGFFTLLWLIALEALRRREAAA